METLSTIVGEIIICLVLAWSLGFLVAWVLFRKAAKVYEQEVEELEENLSYSMACNRNQEKEIIRQAQEIEKLEKLTHKAKKELLSKTPKKQAVTNSKKPTEERSQKELEMLKRIEENLYSVH